MKDKNIKDAYENIEISEREKNKIYNNIMENRKKKFSWLPIVGFGAVALASVGVFMFMGTGKMDSLLGKNKKDNGSSNDNNVVEVSRNIKLENSLKKEVIIGAKEYLVANKIDLDKLEDGKELVIETDKIVKKDDYKACSGKLIIKRYNDDFSYSTDVTCEGDDKEITGSEEFIVYSGIIDNVFEVNDYIAVSSINNYSKSTSLSGGEIIDNDINLTLVDKQGKIIFNKLIESVFKNENSTIEVKGINKINDKYYVVLDMYNNIQLYDSGSIKSKMNHYYVLILDNDGKEVALKELTDENGVGLLADTYVGSDNDVAYYTGFNYTDNQYVIISVSKDKVELTKYIPAIDLPELSRQKQYRITDYYNGKFYGYSEIKSYSGPSYRVSNIIFAMDKKGEVVFEKEINEGDIYKVIVKNDLIYVFSNQSRVNHSVSTYDLEGNLKNSIDIKQLTELENYNIDSYVDDNLVLRVADAYKKNARYVVLDSELKKVNEYAIDSTNVDKNFEWSNLVFSRLNGDKINSIYTVNKDINGSNSILLVFNK